MLKAHIISTILFSIMAVSVANANSNGPAKFGERNIFFNGTHTIKIFYIDIMDQHGMSGSDLRRSAAAKLVIDCGSSCSQNLPTIVLPIESAKKIDDCPRAEIMFIVDFDDTFSIEYFRGANIFRFRGVCYNSLGSGKVLREIFDFF